MPRLKVLCRVITYDYRDLSILLVRNLDQNWWYAPGGGWDYTKETMVECAKRETLEETGIRVNITKLLYVQTLYIKKLGRIRLEQFWLAEPAGSIKIPLGHIDQHGVVDEARWFNRTNVQAITVYPKILKNTFWDTAQDVIKEKNRYIGHFVL